jgi:hypothetical protein
MDLVEGVDFQLAGVDYEEMLAKTLSETFDTDARDRNAKFWDYVDAMFIDEETRDADSICPMDPYWTAIEDYCKECLGLMNREDLPALYRSILDAGAGFCTQAKYIQQLQEHWVVRFPEPLRLSSEPDALVVQFREFVQRKKDAMPDAWPYNVVSPKYL